jgi:hypothetical protein
MPTVDDDKKVVSGSNANSTASTTTTISDFDHPGGLLIVFHTTTTGTSSTERTVSLTFDGASATKLGTAFEADTAVNGTQVDAFAIDAAAKTADIVATINTSHIQRAMFAVPVGSGVEVLRTAEDSVPKNNSAALSTSISVDTASGNLVLQFARWRNSGAAVDSYSTDQTQVLSDDSPTRADLSKKTATGSSTTVTTSLDSIQADNVMVSVAVVLASSVNTPTNLNAEQITATSARLTWDYEA